MSQPEPPTAPSTPEQPPQDDLRDELEPPASEAERQARETVRSVSRLEESN